MIFGTYDTPEGLAFFGYPTAPQAVALGTRMRTDWVAFATTGDPGWPAYAPDTQPTRLYDNTGATTGPYPETPSQQIWVGQPPTATTLTAQTPDSPREYRPDFGGHKASKSPSGQQQS